MRSHFTQATPKTWLSSVLITSDNDQVLLLPASEGLARNALGTAAGRIGI